LGGVRDVLVGRRRVPLDARIAILVGVIDEEKSVGPVLRMERDTQQSTLAAVANLVPDVEKRLLAEYVAHLLRRRGVFGSGRT
jgi:hypothetical protein